MVAAAYTLIGGGSHLFVETVTGDKPTTGINAGDRYLDVNGIMWVYNGSAWIEDSEATTASAIGTTSGTAITTDTSGTLQQYLRGLVKMVGDSWNSTVHAIRSDMATLLAGEDLTNNVLGVIFKPVASTTYAPTRYADAGSVTKANIKATPGAVLSIRVTNANAAIRYFQLHNKATAPAAGDTPQTGMSFLLPAGTATVPTALQLDINYFAAMEYFSTGIGCAISTTEGTFTDSATAADHRIKISYV